jgi:hypothetical protein
LWGNPKYDKWPAEIEKVSTKMGYEPYQRTYSFKASSEKVNTYNYHHSGHYHSFCLLFKTQYFGGWILSPSSGGTYSVGSNRYS